MADTWDVMTDGMYGDMPDGFDGDFVFMGFKVNDITWVLHKRLTYNQINLP